MRSLGRFGGEGGEDGYAGCHVMQFRSVGGKGSPLFDVHACMHACSDAVMQSYPTTTPDSDPDPDPDPDPARAQPMQTDI